MMTYTQEVFRFDDLNEGAQLRAVNEIIQRLFDEYTYSTGIEGLDERVESAADEAERMQTPWFAGQIFFDQNEDFVYSYAQELVFDWTGSIVTILDSDLVEEIS